MPETRGRAAEGRSKYYGKYRGRITDNRDPLGRGRVQVQVPQVLNDVNVWALPCVPYAGKKVGFFAIPPVGAGIWVEFEAGDPSYPIWVGCFWGDGHIDSADASPDVKFWKTEKFSIRIDDSVGEAVIENSAGSKITIGATEILSEASFVRAEATGGKKTELGAVSFKVNDGALEVL